MQTEAANLLKNFGARCLHSVFLVPVIFFVANWTIWLGTHGFAHDTGDGIAAFKFVNFVPRYWNWFESGGQPFWFDAGSFRLHDPLMWLFIHPLKLLPMNTLTAFGIYILLQICALGLAVALLVDSLGFSWKIRQLATFLTLFGSLGASVYEQFGMLNIALPFVLILWCLIRLGQTEKGQFIAGIGLTIVHGSFGYHLLMLAPVFLVAGFGGLLFFRSALIALGNALKKNLFGLALVVVSTILVFLSVYSASRHPGSIPILRNSLYLARVDEAGTNLAMNSYHGRNIFDSRMAASSGACSKTIHCATYSWKHLATFIGADPRRHSGWIGPKTLSPWGEYAGFIGRAALLLCLVGLILGRRRLAAMLALLVAAAFYLSLGEQAWAWPAAQRLISPLLYVRHTHFYLAITVVSLIGLFCVGAEAVERRGAGRKVGLVWHLLILCVVAEGLIFHFSHAQLLKHPIAPAQAEMIAAPLPTSLVSRAARLYNPFTFPRSAAGTGFGVPTAIEPLTELFFRREDTAQARSEDIRTLGYVTPFLLEHYLKSRLLLSKNSEAFKRAFGVTPYSILSVHPWTAARYQRPGEPLDLSALAHGSLLVNDAMKQFAPKTGDSLGESKYGIPLDIIHDALRGEVALAEPGIAYLSVPFSEIHGVRLNGKPVAFFKANEFGLAFALPPGSHRIEVQPRMESRNKAVYFFFSGSFLMLAYLLVELRKKENQPGVIARPRPILGNRWARAEV